MKTSPAHHVHVEHVMGTAVTIDLREDRPELIAAVVSWLHDADATFSTYKPGSAVRRLARGELHLDDAPTDVRWVVGRCEQLRLETRGAFDAHAGTADFDPSALVKGWAVQRAADLLRIEGVTDFCINAGGDVATSGAPEPGRPWRVGIRHPLDRTAVAAVVQASGGLAVATSGAYERGAHIVDPRTGHAPEGVLSVTVTGPDLGTADAYATAAFALAADGPAWTLGLDGYEALTVLEDETVLATPGFPAELG